MIYQSTVDGITVIGFENAIANIVCAKKIESKDGKSFWVRTLSGKGYNPYTCEDRKHNEPRYKMLPVKESVYNLYYKFLETKSEAYLLQANRIILEG